MADTPSTHASRDRAAPGHEESDANIAAIFGFAFGLFAIGVAVLFAVWLLLVSFAAREARRATREFPLAAEQESRVPPEPRLQTNPRQDLRDLRTAEDMMLTSYGWVDKNAGIVRIPIREAMKLAVQRGLPTREEKSR
jgi:hypothetical protein